MRLLIIALLVSLCIEHAFTADEVKHAFIAVDNGNNMLYYVNQFETNRNWKVSTDKKPRDIRLSPDGRTFLVSIDKGAVEYDLATGRQTGLAITNQTGIQSAQMLKADKFLLASQKSIFICDAKGLVLKDIPVAGNSRPYIRIVTITPEDTLLYTALNPFCINELDMEGKLLATVKLPDKSYKAVRLKNGNYLASSGDSVSVFEVTSEGEVVKTYGGKKDHPDLDLTFNSGWQQLANGNIVATCWHGHGYKGNGPHLVEYTPENKAVWTWYQPEVKQVTNVLVLQ